MSLAFISGATANSYVLIGDTPNIVLRLSSGTRGQSVAAPQPIKYQGAVTGLTISGMSITPATGTSSPVTAIIGSYPVVQGNNIWYGNGGYGAGDTPVYDDGATYSSPSFTNSGTFPQVSTSFEGVYPVYYTADRTTPPLATALPLVSMLSTTQITDIDMAGFDGIPGHEPFIDIPSGFTHNSINTLYIKVGGTYSASNSLSEYLPTGTTSYLINGASVPYIRYQYSAGTPGGARTIQINLV
jgi:hypothetical protein